MKMHKTQSLGLAFKFQALLQLSSFKFAPASILFVTNNRSTAVLGIAMLMLGMLFCIRRRNHRTHNNSEEVSKEDMELPIFDLSTIAHATDNFSSRNKLGEGGFGPVFKTKQEEKHLIGVSA
uniref:S-locus receptor kinase C-terminal domain-containing protein n=1 Tax=Populus trichocarpa TaxID=3694 RepID=A0A3N7EH22_POPTR